MDWLMKSLPNIKGLYEVKMKWQENSRKDNEEKWQEK